MCVANKLELTESKRDFMVLLIYPRNSKRYWTIQFRVCQVFSFFFDDILIVSIGSVVEHNYLVEKVIVRLDDENFALKLSKGKFFLDKLSWQGFHINSERYRPKRSKLDAVLALGTS